jgi:putative transposase
MQVFGLPRHFIRTARAASRVILGSSPRTAKTPNIVAASRRDAVARWRQAIAQGLSAEDAAKAVGVPRSTLSRWEGQPEPRSKRPRRTRAKSWTPALVEAVEALRLDHPMWGRAKLGPRLRREGFAVSDATVGRIIAYLVARGVVEPVPTLRRRKGGAARAWRRKHATRLPKGHKPQAPGELVQVDTLSVNVRPDRAIKQFTAGACPRA